MATDYQRPYIYVLQATATFGEPGRLLFLNITNGTIENTLLVGGGPTDLTINYGEGRLYVACGSEPATYVVNLTNQALLPSLNLGTEVYRIDAIRPGRIITEGRGSSYYLAMMDTVTGTNVSTSFNRVYEGDGEVDPGGAFYYHCDKNVSSAHIEKFAILDTVLTSTASSLQHPYGSRNLVMSRDGRRLFWFGYVYDTNLVELGGFGTEIFACTANGAVAFGASQVFDTATQAAMYDLPASSNVKAVDGPGQRLWFYTGDSAKTIESLPLAILQKPSITRQVTNQVVYSGNTAVVGVGAAGLSPMAYYWSHEGTNIATTAEGRLTIPNFQMADVGSYGVIVSNAFGMAASSNAILTVQDMAPMLVSQPASTWNVVGSNASFTVTAVGSLPSVYQWQFNLADIIGETNAWLQLANLRLAQEGNYRVVVSNAFGTVTSTNAFLNVVGVDEGLNTTNLTWETGGDVPWFTQTNVTHDGFASLQSGKTVVGQRTLLRTTVEGAATLRFWWQASSYMNTDALSFSTNGVEWKRISGGAGWLQETVYLGSGTHVLEWSYTKTDPIYSGDAAGWLDEVSVTPGGTAPFMTLEPLPQIALVGADVTLNAAASGTPPLSFQWQLNLADIGGATNAGLTVTNIQYANEGSYRLVVSNPVGATNTTGVEVNVVGFTEALGSTNLVWINGGSQPWFLQSNITHDGVAAGQSGTIIGNQQSTLQTSLIGPGTLTFWWKVSSETNNDLLNFSVDGVEKMRISGNVNWQPKVCYLGSGQHELSWKYAKNASINGLADAAWLDEVSYAPGSTAPLIVSGPFDLVPAQGATGTFTVDVVGTPPLSYQWLYKGASIPDATNASLSISNVQPENSGEYSVIVANVYGNATSPGARLYLRNLVAWGAGMTNTIYQPNRGQCVVPTNVFVTTAAGGALYSVVVKPDGRVVAWGDNNSQQTNIPASVTNVVALAAGFSHSLGLQSNGVIAKWGTLNLGTIGVPSSASNAVAVAAGWYHNLVLRSNGTVIAWGAGEYSGAGSPNYWQSRVPTNLNGVKAIAGGGFHSLALRTNGTVVGWGWNAFGQTNSPANLGDVVAIAAGASNSLALRSDGTVVAWGANGNGQTNVPVGLTNVVAIAAGAAHCLALRGDGTLVAWGHNAYGQTNIPAGLSNVTAIAAGAFHNLAMVNVGPVTFPGQPRNNAIYEGSDITLTAPCLGVQPMAFQWLRSGSPLDGATSVSLPIANAQVADAGQYQLIASNYFGSVTSAVVSLTVLETAPHFTTPLTNMWVLPNSNVTLIASIGGLPPFAYQWLMNGVEIAGATNNVLGVTNAQFYNEGKYALRVSNAFGVTLSSDVFLNVLDLADALGPAGWTWYNSGSPPWRVQITNTLDGIAAAAAGPFGAYGSSTLLTRVVGPGKLSFGWATSQFMQLKFYVDDVLIASQRQYSANNWSEFAWYLPAGVHLLKWEIQNTMMSSFPASVFLDQVAFTPGATPAQVVTHPVSQTNSAGTNVTFTVVGAGTPPLNYQWLFNGEPISGAVGESFVVTNIQNKDVGGYRVVVSNETGVVVSSNASLVVTPSAPIIITQPSDTHVMVGQTASVAAAVIGSSPINYQWLFNGVAIADATSPSFTIGSMHTINNGNYALLASNAHGFVFSSNALLVAHTAADFGGPLNGSGIEWSTANVSWFPQTNTTHDGVSAAQSGTISGSQRSTLQGGVTGPATVTYWWKVSCDGFWNNLAFSVDGVIQNSIAGSVDWQQVTNYLGEGSRILNWEIYPTYGNYAGGSGWLDQVEILPGGTPAAITAHPASQTNAAGNNVSFSVAATGTPPLRYQWQVDGIDVSGATNAAWTLNSIQVSNSGFYRVIVTNSFGSTTSSNAILLVNPSGPILTSVPANMSGAINGNGSFSVAAKGSFPLSYQWLFEGSPIPGATQTTIQFSGLQASDAGNYQAVVANGFGAVTTAVYRLDVGRTVVREFWSVVYGSSRKTPPGLTNIMAVAVGYDHVVALREDGTVVSWGNNNYGQTNVPAGLSNVVAIAAGTYHTLALRSDGTVAVWGDFSRGQIFIPEGLTNVTAIAAASFHSFALKDDGTVVGWGNNSHGQLDIPPGLKDVVAISAGFYTGFAVKSDGSAVQWGSGPARGTYGLPVGLPEGTSNAVAIAAGAYNGCTLQNDSTVTCWGVLSPARYSNIANVVASGNAPYNEYIMLLGNDGGISVKGSVAQYRPDIPPGQTNAIAIAAESIHGAVLFGDGAPRSARPMTRRTAYTSENVVFGSGVVGAMPLSFQWQCNGTAVEGATNAFLVITNVPFSAGGNYRCLVSNAFGSITTDDSTLTVLRSTPRFGSLMSTASGGFGFQLDQLSGHGPVVIMASGNLVDWTPILTNPPVTGSLLLLDPAITNYPGRFFRAVEE